MPKAKIIIHNPCNELTRYVRNYNYFWDYFTEYLHQYFDIEENRYYADILKMPYRINLAKGLNENLCLYECEYVIENKDTGEFHIISVSDIATGAILHEAHNPFCKTILVSQFNPRRLFYYKDEIPYKDLSGKEIKNYFYKFKPWIYFQALFQDLDSYYYKRKHINNKSNTLYFKGSALNERTFLDHLDKRYVSDFTPIASNNYFDELIAHKLALSIDGKGEFCYRDIECFAVGVPIIRFEYESVFDQALIPNYHYISLPRPADMKHYNTGSKEHADLLIERYLQVINDQELLSFVSKNARKYYEDNLVYNKIAERTFALLNLQAWVK